MRILLTGSSGWLGQTLAPRLRALGHEVIGLDPVPSQHAQLVGSIADRDLVRRAIVDNGIDAIVHSGALHKPDIERRPREDFIEVNIRGTFNLLEEAVANGVGRFVFTSTTSLMISEAIRAGLAGGAARAAWLTEDMVPEPRNIYGVTKLAAEHLCRLYHLQSGLPVDHPAHRAVLSRSRRHGACDRAVGRQHQGQRVPVPPARPSRMRPRPMSSRWRGRRRSASTPSSSRRRRRSRRDDCEELIVDAPSVVARYFPDYPAPLCAQGLDHVQVDRPRLRRIARQGEVWASSAVPDFARRAWRDWLGRAGVADRAAIRASPLGRSTAASASAGVRSP